MLRVALAALALLLPITALAQGEEPRVDVLVVSGPLDERAISFLDDSIDTIARRGTEVAIIQLDSPAVVASDADFEALRDRFDDPPIPLVAWIGPAPARAYGGALELATAAQVTFAAPGATVGHAEPVVLGGVGRSSTLPPELHDAAVGVETPIDGVIDEVAPSIRQLIQMLDGRQVSVAGETIELATLTPVEGGVEGEVTTIEVVFHQPGYWDRFLRLASTPEAAYFFLLAGLTLAAFEFYAIGPGLAAAVAAVSLFLGAQGVATLPMRWWALALALGGWWALTASYQMGSAAVMSAFGAALLAGGGLFLVDGAPQLQMNPVVTLVIVAGVVAFYLVAMPTVARSRFSTRTIGGDRLVGATGTALVGFDPDGEVEVNGARWRAAAHREAHIAAGDPVRIVAVDGLVLEVEKLAEGVSGSDENREKHP